MLTLLVGRSGSGKTTELMQRLCSKGKDRPQVCIVPEQYSHETERLLSLTGGPGTSMYAEVLSFTRLANRIFTMTGDINVPQLDEGGRLLLMYRAIQSVREQLTVYRKVARRASFLQELITTSDELKSYCITPARLLQTSADDLQNDKLHDLGLILGAYDALIAQRAADPRDRLSRLCEALHTSRYLQGMDVYLDCFTDFTQQELNILDQILSQANSLTIAISCCNPDNTGHHRSFDPALKTIYHLRSLAKKRGIPCHTDYLEGQRTAWMPELNWLEQNYHTAQMPWEAPTDSIELFTTHTDFDQVEFSAGKILQLVRENHWHWRDIGVAVRSIDSWEEEIKSVFTRYGIPITLNRMTNILQKPILSLITSALSAVSGGYSYDDMFRYLKTGLTGVSAQQIDALENYVLTWKIKGTQWTKKDAWSWHPNGYGFNLQDPSQEDARIRVAELDALRREIIAPLDALKKSKASTGADHARALYTFMEKINLQTRLEEQAQLLIQRKDLPLAEEYSQLWEILCNALEQCAALLQQDPMDISEFAQMMTLLLGQYKVGTIPVSLDRVVVGEAPRMSHKDLKCLMILGADDTAFPRISDSAGLLTDDDRQLLSAFVPMTAPSADLRTSFELAVMYEMISLPRQKLIVGYSTQGTSGEEQRPSILYTRLQELFPAATCTIAGQVLWKYRLSAPLPALEYLAETQDQRVLSALKEFPDIAPQVQRLERSFQTNRGHLSSDSVQQLYSRNIRLSATRMDRIKKCHFSYFMEYGLQAKNRKTAEFSSLENGTFIHYILEHLLTSLQPRGTADQWSDEEIEILTRQIIREYITSVLGGLQDKPKRFQYLFGRLCDTALAIVKNVVDELRNSQFQPRYFELEFGKGKSVPWQMQVGNLILSLNGKVDRIDTWQHEDQLYYRIVDYKTGGKAFSYTDIWNGLSLQMLVYQMALDANSSQVFPEGQALPAGVVYLPAKDSIIPGSRDMDPDTLQQEVDKQLVRSGLFLHDTQVIQAMDSSSNERGRKRFLPITITKDGAVSKSNLEYLATLEQMGQLQEHIRQILTDIGKELGSGNVDADPYQHGTVTPCDYCEFASACHFEEGQKGNRRRYFTTLKSADFWNKLSAKT